MTGNHAREFVSLSIEDKGKACFQRAAQLQKENKLEEALHFYGQAIAYLPDQPDAFNNMAVALRRLQKFDAALACYQRALTLRPDHGGTYSNMGNVLNDLDRIDEAIKAHTHAVELDSNSLLYLYNKGLVMRDATRPDEAIELFNQVLSKDENYGDCRWDRALTYLMKGDLKEGFAQYDARWNLQKSPPRQFKQPRWQGDALGQRTLFIHREQGFGDAIQFARLVPSVKKRFGGKVILECQPDLISLLDPMEGVDHFVPFGQPSPAFDTWIPLMSLAHILQVDEENIPGEVPYLHPRTDSRFNVRPAPKGGANIGLVWGGSPTHQNDRRRSVSLTHFLPLIARKNTTVFSLQKGPRTQELDDCGAKPLIIDATANIRDFADTADLIQHLDLVITVDTSVAHLAGALGKEVWVMLPFTPDWRWMLDRTDSPWYPNMRLFRQQKPGDWESAFDNMYRALDEKLTP